MREAKREQLNFLIFPLNFKEIMLKTTLCVLKIYKVLICLWKQQNKKGKKFLLLSDVLLTSEANIRQNAFANENLNKLKGDVQIIATRQNNNIISHVHKFFNQDFSYQHINVRFIQHLEKHSLLELFLWKFEKWIMGNLSGVLYGLFLFMEFFCQF